MNIPHSGYRRVTEEQIFKVTCYFIIKDNGTLHIQKEGKNA